MKEDNKTTRRLHYFISLPFPGQVQFIENKIYVWTDIQDDRVYISTQVFKSDTVQEVQDRLINEWEIEKDRIEKENEEYENPIETQGYPGDSLTL